MILVKLNKRDFEYDIHSLIRAFYPGMEVSVFIPGIFQDGPGQRK